MIDDIHVLIDPPSGWRFGFPKRLPDDWRTEDFNLRRWLVVNGYPEKEVDFGIKYCRYIYKE